MSFVAILGTISMFTATSAGAQAQKPADAPAATQAGQIVLALPGTRPILGDLDGMLKRRTVRILVPPDKTLFFIDKGDASGVTAELGLEFESWLNKRYNQGPFKIEVAFIPTRRDKLFEQLRAGRGDVAAANLTITPSRSALVDFAAPWISNVKEVLVVGSSAPSVASIDDLGGKKVTVRKSSSYYEHLIALNAKRRTEGKPPITIAVADESLEDEDLLEMVNAGLLPWAIVDEHIAKAWANIYKGLTIRDDIAFNEGGQIAWAIRKDSPKLQAEIDQFVAARGIDTAFGRDIRFRYFTDGRTIKNALARGGADRLHQFMSFFVASGNDYGIDPLLIAAQGYQESSLNQSLRMKSGAVGVMQIKPSTAREIGVSDVVRSAANNIKAGSKYVRFLADKYINDPGVDAKNRVLMALAAYNSGPGNLKRFRADAAKKGFDPNQWFGNVENSAAAIVGFETVQYVSNIYKYYVAYKMFEKDRDDRAAAQAK